MLPTHETHIGQQVPYAVLRGLGLARSSTRQGIHFVRGPRIDIPFQGLLLRNMQALDACRTYIDGLTEDAYLERKPTGGLPITPVARHMEHVLDFCDAVLEGYATGHGHVRRAHRPLEEGHLDATLARTSGIMKGLYGLQGANPHKRITLVSCTHVGDTDSIQLEDALKRAHAHTVLHYDHMRHSR